MEQDTRPHLVVQQIAHDADRSKPGPGQSRAPDIGDRLGLLAQSRNQLTALQRCQNAGDKSLIGSARLQTGFESQ